MPAAKINEHNRNENIADLPRRVSMLALPLICFPRPDWLMLDPLGPIDPLLQAMEKGCHGLHVEYLTKKKRNAMENWRIFAVCGVCRKRLAMHEVTTVSQAGERKKLSSKQVSRLGGPRPRAAAGRLNL